MLKALLLTAIFITFTAQAGEAPAIGKQQWMENMQNTLPDLLCQDDRYFMECFDNTHSECMELTQRFVEACLNNTALSLPKTLMAADRKQWGEIVGRCSYDLYEKFMGSQKKDLPACHDKTQ